MFLFHYQVLLSLRLNNITIKVFVLIKLLYYTMTFLPDLLNNGLFIQCYLLDLKV